MSVFFITIQIVLGILSPVICLFLLGIILQSFKGWRESTEYKQKKLEKMQVFDTEAEFYGVPNPTMIGVRLKRRGEIIWEGGIDRPKGQLL